MNTPPSLDDQNVDDTIFESTTTSTFPTQQTPPSNLFSDSANITTQQELNSFQNDSSPRASAFTQVNPFGQLPPTNTTIEFPIEHSTTASIPIPIHPHSLHQRTTSVPVISRTPPLSHSQSPVLNSDSPRLSLQEEAPPMELKNSLLQQVKDSEPFTTLGMPTPSKSKRHFRFKSTDFGLQQVPLEVFSGADSGIGTPTTERSTPPFEEKPSRLSSNNPFAEDDLLSAPSASKPTVVAPVISTQSTPLKKNTKEEEASFMNGLEETQISQQDNFANNTSLTSSISKGFAKLAIPVSDTMKSGGGFFGSSSKGGSHVSTPKGGSFRKKKKFFKSHGGKGIHEKTGILEELDDEPSSPDLEDMEMDEQYLDDADLAVRRQREVPGIIMSPTGSVTSPTSATHLDLELQVITPREVTGISTSPSNGMFEDEAYDYVYDDMILDQKTQKRKRMEMQKKSKPTTDIGSGERGTDVKWDDEPKSFFEKLKFWKRPNPMESSGQRIIIVGNEIEQQRHFDQFKQSNKFYITNQIYTTKYNVVTFLPKNLFEQFSRLANLYFLFIAILQFIPGLSPTGKFSTILPLVIVLVSCAIKDGLEDWKRRISDLRINNRKVTILKNGKWTDTKWRSLRVGDIVKLDDKEPVPADVVVLSTSEVGGLCYVETSSLDGETNLKVRRARPEMQHIQDEASAQSFFGVIHCEKPNKSLYNFEGNIMIGDKTVPLDNDQVLLRGCTLKNTTWIIGTIIFTGLETKLMKNQKKTPHKQSKVEKTANRMVLLIFALLLLLCFICTVCYGIFNKAAGEKIWYMPFFAIDYPASKTFLDLVMIFFTFLVLYSNLIPISLYVSLEICKYIQGYFIGRDLEMYHKESDTPSNVQTSSLNEELGQVQFIFSDKTGTLTSNVMEFLKFSVSGVSYGTGITEIARAAAKRDGRVLKEDRPTGVVLDPTFPFYDPRISDGRWTTQRNSQEILDFFTLLAVCHTCIPEYSKTDPTVLTYQASSPDEAALVKAAQKLGVVFKSRTPSDIVVDILGKESTFDILNVCEFNSNRKRMSVICRNPEGKIILYCKGADTMIFPRLKKHQAYAKETLELLEVFAKEGLRTLACAKVELDEQAYFAWAEEYNQAKALLVDRSKTLEQIAEKIEVGMDLVGVTAIEDKLQDGVPDAIAELAKANIRIWVLTGDRQETAINIGFACDLLNNHMGLIVLEGADRDSLIGSIRKNADAAQQTRDSAQALALIVDGQKLEMVLKDKECSMQFLRLALMCKALICCRVSPSQKADVVLLVKKNIQTITLAIGDGANDVAMIQAAHVGVGISGMEGLQAANAADYSIGQFRFLKKLLIVHGRWSYRRNSKLILYSFYKNIVLYLTQLWFVFHNGFSGNSILDEWAVALYNVLFTSLPIMFLAVFDYDLPAAEAIRYPQLYFQGQKSRFFNPRVFVQWTLNALFHSAVCFFIPVWIMGLNEYYTMRPVDKVQVGIAIYTATLATVTLKVMLEMSVFNILNTLIIIASLAAWPTFIILYSYLYSFFPENIRTITIPYLDVSVVSLFNDIAYQGWVFTNPAFYLTVLLTVVVAISRDYAYKAWKRLVYKKLYYEVQRAKGKKPKEEILAQFPFEEEHLPIRAKHDIDIFSLPEIKNLLQNVTKLDLGSYRGYAFSESDNTAKYMQEKVTHNLKMVFDPFDLFPAGRKRMRTVSNANSNTNRLNFAGTATNVTTNIELQTPQKVQTNEHIEEDHDMVVIERY